jgi:hypothetical protein
MKKKRFCSIILLVILLAGISAYPAHAIDITAFITYAQGVTTFIRSDVGNAGGAVDKLYEISPSSRDSGYSLTIREREEIRLPVLDNVYLIYATRISDDALTLTKVPEMRLLPGPETENITLREGESKLFRFQDSKNERSELIEIRLDSVSGGAAVLLIRTYDEQSEIETNYTQLFDVELKLVKAKVAKASDLSAYINFVNFGEGASQVDITYRITDSAGKEWYLGADRKVVFVQDSVIKSFDSLTLPEGDYQLEARIDYGKNQTAGSRMPFSVAAQVDYSQFLTVGIFILVVAGLFLFFAIRTSLQRKSEDANRDWPPDSDGR